MCGGYRLELDPDALAAAFAVDHTQLELPWPVELHPGQRAPVVLDRRSRGGETTRHLGALRWGLVPAWADDPALGRKLFNARIETADSKPSFREAFARRRCLVPAEVFLEWTGEPGHKLRFGFAAADGELLALAGLWEVWQPPGGKRLATFTVLTTAASPDVSAVHPRMPLLVPRDRWTEWLQPGQAPEAALIEALQAHTQAQRLHVAELPR